MAKRETVKVEEVTFGVEIECTVPLSLPLIVGTYSTPIQVPELPDGWKAGSDISIDAAHGRRGVEIVSPVLKGADGLRQVIFVMEWLEAHGAKINRSCGFHVHAGFGYDKADQLARLFDLVARHEKGLYASTGTKSRETGDYAKPVKTGRTAEIYKDGCKASNTSWLPDRHSDRYFTLNLTNLADRTRPAVEYRVFSGTLNPVKAVGFIRLALGLTCKALNSTRRVKWDHEAAYQRCKGAGHAALAALFFDLGWCKAKDAKLGVVEGEGIPTLADTKAELVRLARKYDGGAED